MNTLNNFKPFQTIVGYNLLEEINNFISKKTCIVTMKDLWEKFESNLHDFSDAYFVSSLEEGVEMLYSFEEYKEMIPIHGIFAIHFNLIS